MAIITDRGRWANSKVDERGRRVFSSGLTERGQKVFGLSGGSGTTYSGSGAIQVTSSLSSNEIYIYKAIGNLQGISNLTSNEITIYKATGSLQSSSSLTSSETIIGNSGTTYSGSGSVTNSSSLTSSEIKKFSAIGNITSLSSLSDQHSIVIFQSGGSILSVVNLTSSETQTQHSQTYSVGGKITAYSFLLSNETISHVDTLLHVRKLYLKGNKDVFIYLKGDKQNTVTLRGVIQ